MCTIRARFGNKIIYHIFSFSISIILLYSKKYTKIINNNKLSHVYC